jgi:hypothetical protein
MIFGSLKEANYITAQLFYIKNVLIISAFSARALTVESRMKKNGMDGFIESPHFRVC